MEMDAARKHNDNWTWQAWKLLEPVKFVGSDFILWFILADRAVFRVLSVLFGRGALCWSDHPNINAQMHYWMELCASLYVVWHQKEKVGWSCTNQMVDINTFCCVCVRPCELRVSSLSLSTLKMWKCCCRALFLPLLRASTKLTL